MGIVSNRFPGLSKTMDRCQEGKWETQIVVAEAENGGLVVEFTDRKRCDVVGYDLYLKLGPIASNDSCEG